MNIRHLAIATWFVSVLVPVITVVAQDTHNQESKKETSPKSELAKYLDPFESSNRVRLNIDLSDQDLAELKTRGRLQLRIPEYYENRVAAILLRHVDSYSNEKVRVDGEPRVMDDVSHVQMGELMVERLRYQPIEYRVFEKNFTYVEICFIEESQAKVFVADNDQSLTRDEYQIQIANRFNVNAKISKRNEIILNTSFGTHRVPWTRIDRIQFASSEVASAKLFLTDGSAVSGHLELEKLDLKTRWGKITIPAHDLRSISR